MTAHVCVPTAYLMHKQHKPFITVLQHIRTVRPIATPNPSFAVQLLHLQGQLGIPPATSDDEAAVIEHLHTPAADSADADGSAAGAAGAPEAASGDSDSDASKRAALAKLKQTLVKKVQEKRGK